MQILTSFFANLFNIASSKNLKLKLNLSKSNVAKFLLILLSKNSVKKKLKGLLKKKQETNLKLIFLENTY